MQMQKMTQETALKHVKHAWVAGVVSAGVGLLFILIAASGSTVVAELGVDWQGLVAVVVILGLAFGLYKKSRICAVLMFVNFVGSKIIQWATTGNVSAVPLAILFGYFFFQGIRGTFAYHSLSKQTAPEKEDSRMPKWLWLLGGSAAVVAVLIMGLLVYAVLVGPDIEVVPGAQVPQRFLSKIRALDLLEPGERVRFFYSDAFINIEEGFYLFTDRKVVVYKKEYEQPAVVVPFSEIKNMDIEFSGSTWEDSHVYLTLADESVVSFPVSSEGGGDKKFYESLRATWASFAKRE